MKNIILILSLCLLTNISFSQTFCLSDFKSPKVKTKKITNRKKINFVVDSLRTKIFSDTLKFDFKDLVLSLSNNQTNNQKKYSTLFNVEGYSYKLDIVNGKLVTSFINEMLVSSKIKRIFIVDKNDAKLVFGEENGIIYIDLKNDSNVNFNVAGLNNSENFRVMNNFYQLKFDKVKFD